MSRKQKILLGVAILLMSLALWLPIWKIEIWAPQYPEGLFLQIAASRIDGNVDQINILNHYIGMKHIVPAQIPELTIIPWVLSGILVLGILVTLMNKMIWVRVWLALVSVLTIVGLIDFYRWGYDYGHNLDPNAPIKIPGFTYQPPLLGFKQILNIEAYSLPDIGTYALALGFALAFGVAFWDKFRACRKKKGLITILSLVFLFVSCTHKPEPLQVGIDHCDNCHMQITDARFGGELLTKKGRIYKFDSIQCLHEYLAKNSDTSADIYVSDYFQPKTLVKADVAHFLTGSTIVGPMGLGAVASKDQAAIEKLKVRASGKVTTWKDLSSSSF